MKPPDAALRELVRQWLDKAAADFDAGRRVVDGSKYGDVFWITMGVSARN